MTLLTVNPNWQILMGKFNAAQTLDLMLDLGKQRASKNKEIFEEGIEVEDYLNDTDSDIAIHDPWTSSCGRFEVDPFNQYGKAFVEWLMRPFYEDGENIVRRLNELKPVQETRHVQHSDT